MQWDERDALSPTWRRKDQEPQRELCEQTYCSINLKWTQQCYGNVHKHDLFCIMLFRTNKQTVLINNESKILLEMFQR